MNKTLLYLFIFIGSGIGTYLPVIFGQSAFSAVSIIGGAIGGIMGIWAAIKFSN